MSLKRFLRAVVPCVLGLTVAWAGIAKLMDPKLFFLTLLEYRLPLPDPALRVTAVTLPWRELLCGVLLCANRWRSAALSMTACLASLFAVTTGQAWGRGLALSCGCFGAYETGFWASPAVAFTRALALLAAAIWMLRGTDEM